MRPQRWVLALALCLLEGLAIAAEPAVAPAPTVAASSSAEALPSDVEADATATTPPAAVEPAAPKAPEAATESLTSIPLGAGLPVVVRAGVYFLQLTEIDDNEGSFAASIDVRLRWRDARQAFPAEEAPRGFKEFRGSAADTRLAEMWQPNVALDNLKGEPTDATKGLRMFPDGSVELVTRLTGTFETLGIPVVVSIISGAVLLNAMV